MKWFRMDSDTPSHPTSRRVIRNLGNAGFGALVRLWCFTAQFGKLEAGRCVDSDGDPIPQEDLIDACGLESDDFDALVAILLFTKCIDRDAWEKKGEMKFPGMMSRADTYTKKVQKSVQTREEQSSTKFPYSTRQDSTSTEQGKTLLEVFGGELKEKGKRHKAAKIMTLWNEVTSSPIPKCRGLTAKRISGVLKLEESFPVETVEKAFKAVNASKFCRGENDNGWKATFDWIIKPDSILKTIEGKYDDRQKAGNTRSKSGKYDRVERQ